MAYTPTAKTIQKLKAAIKSYNSAISRMAQSSNYSYLPLKTNIVVELEHIYSSKDMRTRIKQLRRILTTVNKGAQKPVVIGTDEEGYKITAPKYLVDEVKYIVRDINTERQALRQSLYPDWDIMSKPEQAIALSNRNLTPLREEDYITGEDLNELVSEQYAGVMKKAEVYISVWEDFNGDPRIPDMIREMAEGDPDGFRVLMESPDVEKEIEYVYGDVGAGGSVYTGKSKFEYKRASAFRGSQINRYSSAVEYWEEQYQDYHNRTGYFS